MKRFVVSLTVKIVQIYNFESIFLDIVFNNNVYYRDRILQGTSVQRIHL